MTREFRAGSQEVLLRNISLKIYWLQLEHVKFLNFRCGHSYHKGCLQSIGSVHVIDGEDSWICYLCSHRKRGQFQSTRFHRSLSNRGQPKSKDVSRNSIFSHNNFSCINFIVCNLFEIKGWKILEWNADVFHNILFCTVEYFCWSPA